MNPVRAIIAIPLFRAPRDYIMEATQEILRPLREQQPVKTRRVVDQLQEVGEHRSGIELLPIQVDDAAGHLVEPVDH